SSTSGGLGSVAAISESACHPLPIGNSSVTRGNALVNGRREEPCDRSSSRKPARTEVAPDVRWAPAGIVSHQGVKPVVLPALLTPRVGQRVAVPTAKVSAVGRQVELPHPPPAGDAIPRQRTDEPPA